MRTKLMGVIGGIAPESTIEYYRFLVAAHRERTRDGSYPAVVVNSIDLTRMLSYAEAKDLTGLADYLSREVGRLVAAGAEVAILASNTPHLVFDEVRRASPIPLISIVEATCEVARDRGLRRLGLFGTRFTMQGRFYPDVFTRNGIALVVPSPDEQAFIHDAYMSELVNGVFRDETRARLLAIADRLRDGEAIDGLILGGTELPLILRETGDRGIPFLDTTRIHVEALVAASIEAPA